MLGNAVHKSIVCQSNVLQLEISQSEKKVSTVHDCLHAITIATRLGICSTNVLCLHSDYVLEFSILCTANYGGKVIEDTEDSSDDYVAL